MPTRCSVCGGDLGADLPFPICGSCLGGMDPNELGAFLGQHAPKAAGLGFLPGCPACGWSGSAARKALASHIVGMVRSQGGFQVSGVQQFWGQFKSSLCDSCRWSLDGISGKRRQAVTLLEEAVEADRKNKAAKQNLEVARKMV